MACGRPNGLHLELQSNPFDQSEVIDRAASRSDLRESFEDRRKLGKTGKDKQYILWGDKTVGLLLDGV